MVPPPINALKMVTNGVAQPEPILKTCAAAMAKTTAVPTKATVGGNPDFSANEGAQISINKSRHNADNLTILTSKEVIGSHWVSLRALHVPFFLKKIYNRVRWG